MRPDCPDCGEALGKPFTSCRCGWLETPKKKDRDPPRVCFGRNDGVECSKTGYLTRSVTGRGPWYCRTHFTEAPAAPLIEQDEDDVEPLAKKTAMPQEVRSALSALIKKKVMA